MEDIKHLIRKDLANWHGFFELFQNETFLQIKADYEDLEVMEIGKVFGIFSKKFLLGFTSGFIGNPEIRDPKLTFLKNIKFTGAAKVRIHSNVMLSSLEKFRISPHDQYDFVIDVSRPESEILKSVRKHRRRSLKKTTSQGLSFTISTSYEDCCFLHNLCDIVFHHQLLFDVPSPELMYSLIKNNLGVMGLTVFDDNIVGGTFCLRGENALYGWIMCVRREYHGKKLSIGDFMYLNIIKWAHNNGFTYLGLGHQSIFELPTIASYKLSFNPILVPCYDYEVVLRPNKLRVIEQSRNLREKIKMVKLAHNLINSKRIFSFG